MKKQSADYHRAYYQAKRKDYAKNYYRKNAEKLKAYQVNYRKEHGDRIRARNEAKRANRPIPLNKAGLPDLRSVGRRWSVIRQDKAAYTRIYDQLPERREARKAGYARLGPRPRPGWTRELRAAVLAQQEGRCAICRQPFITAPCQDHDARTKKARGLLCHGCNHMIGKAHDSPEVLDRAAAYLRRYQ